MGEAISPCPVLLGDEQFRGHIVATELWEDSAEPGVKDGVTECIAHFEAGGATLACCYENEVFSGKPRFVLGQRVGRGKLWDGGF